MAKKLEDDDKPRRRGGRPKMEEPSPVDIHVGSRVRQRRILLHMSQEKLGAALGLTFQQVQKYERGTNRISASRLWDLGKILDVPVSFFFDSMPLGAGEGAGFAEQSQAAYEPGAPTDRATAQLMQAYQRISNPELKRRLLDFVRVLADHTNEKPD